MLNSVKQAEKMLTRARSTIELELWELEAEARRRFRDGCSLTGLTQAMVKWKNHLNSIEEAEQLLAGAKQGPLAEQRPVCETIVRNLGRFPMRIVTHH
ncbi:hypothetical protein FVA81_01490 (plasmid) [Rhizobium sp. WL3]|uniref:hypothetical protein n=1 Tax=Rhizobium sp. WL3 TaxID=2603277 RepID=UPI0011C204F1|nr:hypothetical protein [Rhizobium sp. WL3]QEE43348.1 hypothetical protein FVA81_01490 [Rhizobium sp. WL3]